MRTITLAILTTTFTAAVNPARADGIGKGMDAILNNRPVFEVVNKVPGALGVTAAMTWAEHEARGDMVLRIDASKLSGQEAAFVDLQASYYQGGNLIRSNPLGTYKAEQLADSGITQALSYLDINTKVADRIRVEVGVFGVRLPKQKPLKVKVKVTDLRRTK